jgi:hypothetical protein
MPSRPLILVVLVLQTASAVACQPGAPSIAGPAGTGSSPATASSGATPANAASAGPTLASSNPAALTAAPTGGVLFDDFSYADVASLERNGWIVRGHAGWPGARGAVWSRAAVSFAEDPARPGNRLARLVASTDGTPRGTVQAQLCQQRKFREGTYATRIRFHDHPLGGPDGDGVVESFYTISPLKDMDPAFSELDFEYLPNGGWGRTGSVLWANSWETARIDPWFQDNDATAVDGSNAGWHTLVLQVVDGTNRFFVDGALVAEHGGDYYPESAMSINYNLWFIAAEVIPSTEGRRYADDIDWVYHEVGVAISPADVDARVDGLRAAGSAFSDGVPAWSPPLASPCDL